MLHRTCMLAVSILVALLTACGGGGGDGGGTTPAPQVPDAIPTGYYDNTGTATLATGNVTDLQGIIHDNRLMMLSIATGFSYDGTITISGNNYSGTLSVYDDGSLLGTAAVTGSITQGVRVTGALAGTGAGSGTFTLNYAANNGEAAALSKVENLGSWAGLVGGSATTLRFVINGAGTIVHDAEVFTGTFNNCDVSGVITPIAGTRLYSVNITLASCATSEVTGIGYTGVATTRQKINADDTLVLMTSKGNYHLAGEFDR